MFDGHYLQWDLVTGLLKGIKEEAVVNGLPGLLSSVGI